MRDHIEVKKLVKQLARMNNYEKPTSAQIFFEAMMRTAYAKTGKDEREVYGAWGRFGASLFDIRL